MNLKKIILKLFYQNENWYILVQLWKYSNLHIIHVINNVNNDKLECDIESIIPKSKSFFSLMISSLFKVTININDLKSDIENYERVILIGPIWAGTLVAPLRGFIKKI